MKNMEIAKALDRLRRAIPPNSNTANLLDRYIELLPADDAPKEPAAPEVTTKHIKAVVMMATNLRQAYQRTRTNIDNIGFELTRYGWAYNELKTMAELVPPNYPDRHHIDQTLEQYSPEDLAGLDEESLESINAIGRFIQTHYDKDKHSGRDAKGLLRGLIRAGKFPANYLAEFDRRFS